MLNVLPSEAHGGTPSAPPGYRLCQSPRQNMSPPAATKIETSPRRGGSLWPGVFATLGLLVAAVLGLELAALHNHLSPVWPAAGVAIWILVMFGQRMWPAVTVVIFLVEMGVAGYSPLAAGAAAWGSTLEAVIGAWLWNGWARRRLPGELREAVACIAIALVAPLASATVGGIGLSSLGAVKLPFDRLWINWWWSDAIGVLAVLPLLLAGSELRSVVRTATVRDWGRALLAFVVAGSVGWVAFMVVGGGVFLFAIFPALLLVTVWFGAPGARLMALLIAAAGIAAEYRGLGPFAGGSAEGNLLNLHLFLAAVSVAALFLPLFRARGNLLLPVTVLLVGWALSGWIFATMQRDSQRRREEVFDERVATAESAIRVRMTGYVDALLGGASYYTASKTVERDDWRAYAESLQLAKRYPGINGIGIIYPVTAAAAPAWLRKMRADGAPNLEIKPFPATTGPAEDVKYVITFVEPLERNRVSVGRNIATEPSRRLAADLARDTGEPQINRRILGTPDALRRSGFLLYVPLYRPGAPVATVAERRAAHLGWVYAQFFADNFLNGVLGPMRESLHLHFFEEGGLEGRHLLYASTMGPGPADPAVLAATILPQFERVTEMGMAGQRFRLGWQRGPNYATGEPPPIAWAAVSFSFATILLAGLVMNLQTTGQRARLLADERTGELAATESRLKAVLDGATFSVIATGPTGTIELFNAGAERMLGYSAAEMVGRETAAFFHLEEELQRCAEELSGRIGRKIEPGVEVFAAIAELGKADEREWTYVRKDGSRLPVLLTLTARRDGAGRMLGLLGIAQDITLRKQVEAVREEDLARLGKLGSQLPGMIYQFRLRPDGSSCFPYASEGIRQIYRVTPEEVREDASKVFGVLHPDDLAAVAESIHVSARTLEPWRCEYRVRYADGTERWLLGNSVPEREADGGVLWHGFITDVTERRHMELAVAEHEARLRLVLDEMPVGVRWVRNVDSRRVDILNPAHEQITGVRKQDSQTPDVYLKRTHPDDVAAQEAGMKRLRRGEISNFSIEKRFLLADSRVRWVMVTWARRILPGRENYEELSTVMDITAQKEAELALRSSLREVSVLRTALDAHALVAVTDLEGRITQANARFCEVSKYSAKELIGQSTRRINSGLHPKEFFAEMWTVIGRGEIWRGEMRNRAKDGSLYWVSAAIVPSMDESGRPVGFVAIQIDITERKRLEESLGLARDQALEASRLKSEFLATISHEIRTPMNAVIGMAGLLAETRLDQEQNEMVRTINGGAENLLAIINDILDFSRIEAGRMRLDALEFDFRRVVEETVALLAPRAHEKGLEFTCEFDPEPGSLLLGDSGRVRQVLTNLMGNAIKFTDTGEVSVRVTVLAETAARTRLRVAVRDTGVGIPFEAQPRLFQPFTQADGSTTRRFGGTGLGLAICRQLVELMGGEISFESEPGKGSTFQFELDLNRRGPVTPVPVVGLPPGRRVLVVDDNETNRRILIGQLTRWGVQVAAVPSGPAALAMLRDPSAGPWHLVLLDWHMPEMGGLELAGEIRADPVLAELPLVMLSSAGPQADQEAVNAADFSALLTKPVTEVQLSRCLARVLSATDLELVEPPKPEPVPTVAPGGLRLLLVEDNVANQRVASMLLAKMGFHVEVAANGQIALARLGSATFDAVLMDCQMPVLDGYETTRRIRAGLLPGVNPRLPIIALTAYARPEDRERGLTAGMDDYVTKPIRPLELRAALERRGLGSGMMAAAASEAGGRPELQRVFDEVALEAARGLPGAEGPSLLPELVRLYLSDEAERLARLQTLATERRGEQLGDEAHAFGGNAASFGGADVRRETLEVEEAARAGDWLEVSARLQLLFTACERLRTEIARRNLAAR